VYVHGSYAKLSVCELRVEAHDHGLNFRVKLVRFKFIKAHCLSINETLFVFSAAGIYTNFSHLLPDAVHPNNVNFLNLRIFLTKVLCCCVGASIYHLACAVMKAVLADFLNIVIPGPAAGISEEKYFLP